MQYRNIKILVVFLVSSFALPFASYAQIEVNGANELPFTPNNIIENVFLGPGVQADNIQYDGSVSAVGVFSNGSTHIGLERGIVLSTGFAKTIQEPNDENTNAGGGTSNETLIDNDLQLIAGANSELKDIARYEFTFTPESDTIRFRYVFASEEYPESVCSNFNDVFGFFISGPNPSGGNYNALNIARVPDPADPSGATFLNSNVAINSVNNGMIGNLGNIDPDNCAGSNGSLNFSQYYNEVDDGEFPVFDAYLDVFIAQAAVVPCQEYTIKLAIADVKDRDFDSAVFLESGSFFSSSLDINLNTASNDGSIAEGCTAAQINIKIPFAKTSNTNISISTIPDGTFIDQATTSLDYVPLATNINIPAGATSTSIILEAIDDGIMEADEFIYLQVQRSSCIRDTLKIKIRDNNLPQVKLPGDTSLCQNDLLVLVPEYDPPIVEFADKIFTNSNMLILEESGGVYSSMLSVQSVEIDELSGGVLSRICIDSLVSRNLTDIEVYLIAPQGQILELTTNNGDRMKPSFCDAVPNDVDCIDAYYNTCFTVTADDIINNGNPLQGTVFAGNENYRGEFSPEGDWEKLYIDDASANGDWELVVKTDSVSTADLSNGNSFLGSWSLQFESPYEVIHNWSPNFASFCTVCDTTFVSPDLDVTYKLNVTDTYGCTSFDEIRIDALPVTELPEIIDCIALSPSSIQITWQDVGQDVEFYNVNQNQIAPTFETTQNTYTFEGLEAGTEHTFYLAAFNGFCNTDFVTISCSTEPCTDGPTIDMVQPISPSCIGRNDGGIMASASADDGGVVTYYVNGQVNITGDFTTLFAGDYLLRTVDADGCSTVQTVTIPEADDIEIEVTGAPISCVGDGDATAEINILETDNGPYTILWQNASEDFVQEDLAMGTYFFTITDGSGCKYEKNVQISDPEPLEFLEVESQMPPCFGDQGSINITMTGGTPNYNYEWEDTAENTSSVEFFPGTYNLTVTDNNGCTISHSFEIDERLEINLIPDTIQAACIGDFSQEFDLDIIGGESPFDVMWNDNISGVEVIDVPVGFYELTITDENNCVKIDSVEIINFPDLIIDFDINEPGCFNIFDGILSLKETFYANGDLLPNPSIIWEDGRTDEAIGNLKGDSTYHFVVTDGFGCKHADSFYLPGPPAIILEIDTISMLDCFGDTDGSFGVTASGGTGDLIMTWSDNIPTLQNDIASELGPGIYSVTVTDEDNCRLIFDFVMTQPDELNYLADVRDVKCFGEETGSINGKVQGGVSPYDLEWSNGSDQDTLMSLASGIYDLFVTDANGCTFDNSYEIEEPDAPLEVSVEAKPTECFGTDSGSVCISATGGTMPYNFLLNSVNYFDNALITGLPAETYDLLVIDANGCEFNIQDIMVLETDEIFVSLPMDTTLEFGSSLELDYITNATNLVDFFWESSSPEVILSCYECPNPVIETVTTSFFVTLTVRDENGCKYTTERQRISVEDNSFIEVPTGFSPNLDNRNDRLFIFGKEGVKIMNFEIFDRWGERILSVEDIVISDTNQFQVWDGTFNDKEMDSGVYVWKIRIEKLNGEIDYLEGNVTLLR